MDVTNSNEINDKNKKIDKDYLHLEKRLDDFKTFASIVGGSISVLFAALIILFAFNYHAERRTISELSDELKTEVREFLGKGEKRPDIVICDRSGNSMENQTIDGTIDCSRIEDGVQSLKFLFYIKNIGNTVSGDLWFKYYANKPLKIGPHETDDETFHYATLMDPDQHSLGRLPGGGFSTSYSMKLRIFNKNTIPEKSYPMLIRIYNDSGLLNETKFKVNTFNK